MAKGAKIFQWSLGVIGAGVAIAVMYAGVKADRLARIGAGYKAMVACSEIFLAGRPQEDVLAREFAGMDPLMEKIKLKIDSDRHSVEAAAPLGLGHINAIFRKGYGCTLANGGRIAPLPELAAAVETPAPWPEAPPASDKALFQVDYAAVDYALDNAFENNEANHRSILVAVDGKIVEERYADGFSKDTRFLSWSMAKSVTATLVGAAVLRGYLDIDDPAPVPEWAGDAEKSKITWNDLLHMQSGLRFGEDYDVIRSDVNRMLFEAGEAGAVTVSKPLDYPPGEFWYYSSGTTNLIARTLAQVLAKHDTTIYAFARDAVFDPIGATSFVIEPDAAGGALGSSFVYATARDWARLGELYLRKGVWNGERLLPEGWADVVSTPAAASDKQYGAHFWLNYDGENGRERFVPGAPEELYYMAGHEGQYVFIIPSKRLVIVRTGITRNGIAIDKTAPVVKALYDAVGIPAEENAG